MIYSGFFSFVPRTLLLSLLGVLVNVATAAEIAGYYAGSSSDGQWVAAYVSGSGSVDIMVPEVPVFSVQIDESGSFQTTVADCSVSGNVDGAAVDASADCDEGVITFSLQKTSSDGPGANFAGVYEQADSNFKLQALVTPPGSVFYNAQSGEEIDAGTGNIAASGDFTVSSDYEVGGGITGTASVGIGIGELNGTYQTAAGAQDFKMFTLSTRAPTAISIAATQGTGGDRIYVDVEVPDLRSPYGAASIIVYYSFTDQFADSVFISPIVTALGGYAPGVYREGGSDLHNQLIFPRFTLTKAPRLYFWAVLQTSDGVSAPVGPTSGWYADRDTIPTIYLVPQLDSEAGAALLAALPSPSTVGQSYLQAYANLPGDFIYTPAEGTPLEPGEHVIDIEFIPSVVGYYKVTQSFTVTVASDRVPAPARLPSGVLQLLLESGG